MHYIKQFGLQRSGTNVVKALLELNFEDVWVLQDYLGHKHAESSWSVMEDRLHTSNYSDYELSDIDVQAIKPLLESKSLPLIFNLKEPVSWVNSYYKYQRKKVLFKNPDAQFPFDVAFADRVLKTYESVVSSWISLISDSRNSFVFIHEDVVSGAVIDKLDDIKSKLGLTTSSSYPLRRLDGYARRGIDSQHGSELINEKMRFDRDYHLSDGWMDDVPSDVMTFIMERRQVIYNKLDKLPAILNSVIT